MSELIDFAELRDSARTVLTDECSSERLHKFVDGDVGFAATLRKTMTELGWYGLPVPEQDGGLGLGCGDLAAIYYELGRCCAPSDYLGSMLVVHALLLGQSSSQRSAWLPALAGGEVGAAVWGLDQCLHPDRLPIVAESRGDALVLDGRIDLIVDAAHADLLLLPARERDGAVCWILLDGKQSGIALQPVPSVDHTRNFSALQLAGVAVSRDTVLASGGAAVAMANVLLDHAGMALACDSIGGAEAVFEKTVDYLNTRKQFNRVIGSFQALKHRCADLKVALVASGCSVDDAVQSMRSGSGDFSVRSSMAKSYATDVYARVAADAIQLHGGIGFTWEQDCHLYLKRAKLNQQWFGGGSWHRDRVARLLLQRFAAPEKSC